MLPDYHFTLVWPVQWGDQDAFGHVNNTVYFRWMESARIAYMDQLGLDDMYATQRIGPILASIKCDYRRQLHYPDTIEIGAKVTRLGRSSIGLVHAIFSQQQQAVVAEGDSTLVVFDYKTQQSHPIPTELRAAIEKLEQRTF
jgi:acyl-CoA thioester hydrolase